MVDIVITYVNCFDKDWQNSYEKTVGKKYQNVRYRDWGTLVYLFRGIATNMPFVRNVFLIVSNKSQVPTWVNQKTVKIVEHKDFIPEEFLPTFNSCCIELFLHRIEGLSERYIYFNDDCFPIKKTTEEDFYKGGKAVLGFMKRHSAKTMFAQQCLNSYKLAKEKSENTENDACLYITQQHTCTPFLKSVSEECFGKIEEVIPETISKTREEKNINQYVFSLYGLFTGKYVNSKMSFKYTSLENNTMWNICKEIRNPGSKILCFNDTNKLNASSFKNYRNVLKEVFNNRFPIKSKYEN